MESKLTLSIDSDVIEEAKIYARAKGSSLSNIIETVLKEIIKHNCIINSRPQKKNERKRFSGVYGELYGALKLPGEKDTDLKKLKQDYLVQKYLYET